MYDFFFYLNDNDAYLVLKRSFCVILLFEM